MSTSVNGIKNFKFEKVNTYSEYKMVFENEEVDYISIDWTSKTVSAVWEAIELYASVPYYEVLPSIVFDDMEEVSEKKMAEAENSIVSPEFCLKLFDANDVLEKVKEFKSEYFHQMVWLYETWSKGYSVYTGD